MRKIIALTALVTAGFVQAQDYFFDRLVQYELDEKEMVQLYYSTENPNVYLQLNDGPNGERAEIYDKSTRKVHHFEVIPVQEQNGLIYEYKYLNSNKLPVENDTPSGLQYEFKTKRDDKYYRFTDLNVYHSDSEKPFLTADLSLRYTEENQFDAFSLCCLLGFDQWNLIKPDADFVVVKAVVTDESGKIHNYRLIDDQVIQFKLRVNEK